MSDPIHCSACGALVTQIGLMYGLGDRKLRRTLICIKGHAVEDGPATSVAWSVLAKEEGIYDKIVDSTLIPYDPCVVALRVDGHWRVVQHDDPSVGAVLEGPIENCKFCGGSDVSVIRDGDAIVLSCDGCDAYGPEGKNLPEAVSKWNGRV